MTWLADDVGVIGRDQRVRLVDGQPCGSQTFAWPIMTRLQELLDYFQEHGHHMPVKTQEPNTPSATPEAADGLEGNSTPGFEATSSPSSRQLHPHAQRHSSLTSAPTPTAAEGSSESLTGTTTDELAQGGQRRADARGGRTSEQPRASDDADTKADLAPPAPRPKAPARNGSVHVNGQVKAPCGPSTAAAPPPWSPPPPPKNIQLETDEDQTAWRKAMRFRALWEEAIVRSATVSSSSFTLPDQKAAYDYFQKHREITGSLPVAVAIQAWQLAQEGAQPRNSRRRVYHIQHSLDPRQFLHSMHSGKIEAEVGLFMNVNAWETLRWWFTESELVYLGLKVPVLELDQDQLWEYDPRAPGYYRDRHRELPPEVATVAAKAPKPPSATSA